MKIEVLFPEMCNLFGDLKSMDYLALCLPEAEFIRTSYSTEPLFVTESPSLIYMGPMSENAQEKVIQKLMPYRERLAELIENGSPFFFTGNAVEILGHYIEKDDGSRLAALDILPIWAKRDMMHRHNSKFVGQYEGNTIVGFKSQFTMAYTDTDIYPLFTVEKGIGLNEKLKYEGIRKNNFFGTYVQGPLLVLNPEFTKNLLTIMGLSNPTLAFEKEVSDAYLALLQDFKDKG
ncbi:hypothetical protein [Scatolibacter rhodanostii]|uniref:hypothetical protein n=1 Tax=Scatolibacter rhodanostii TaxID=2014781 RepID=UPI000C06DD99|nr:hypothetical protein [Scatolibacter rhodanostii]